MTQQDPVAPASLVAADESAFHTYTKGTSPLADELRGLVSGGLGANADFDGNAFSQVGNEVGLSDAIRRANQRQLDRINGLADSTTRMSDAVRNTWTDYESAEDERSRWIRDSGGELT